MVVTNKNAIYVDGFAGKGIFEDESKGSPLLVLEKIRQALQTTKFSNIITPYYIELNYADELKKNLDNYENVINGDYKIKAIELLEKHKNNNIFLYVDPFGIKHLHYDVFEKLAKNKNSVETLINLNSFGFVREACRLLKLAVGTELDEMAGVEEDDNTKNSIENMNKVAGGEYWQDIISLIDGKKITAKKVEEMFVNKYMERLGEDFEYIFNFAIKTGDDLVPKYRMIFATNHIQGALLMSEQMIKCDIEMSLDNHNQQQSFFDYEYTKSSCKDSIVDILQNVFKTENKIECKDLCLLLYIICGPKYLHKDFTKALLELEQENKIKLDRQTKFTPTGKQSFAMPFIKDNIYVIKEDIK